MFTVKRHKHRIVEHSAKHSLHSGLKTTAVVSLNRIVLSCATVQKCFFNHITLPPPFLISSVHFLRARRVAVDRVCVCVCVCFCSEPSEERSYGGKVSWQQNPRARFETASYNLIRNQRRARTLPLNSGFTDTPSPSLSLSLSPPHLPLLCLLSFDFQCVFPLSPLSLSLHVS